MKIPEIERRLKSSGMDANMRYVILSLQEQILANTEALDAVSDLVIQIATNMANLSELHAVHDEAIKRIVRGRKADDADMVESVLVDPEEIH